MKKLTITIMLAFIVSASIAQVKIPKNLNLLSGALSDSTQLSTSSIVWTDNVNRFEIINYRKLDTVQVLAYCVDDFDKPLLSWRKLYAVYGWDIPSVNLNGLMIYKKYLMPDRKTVVSFKVVYAINK